MERWPDEWKRKNCFVCVRRPASKSHKLGDHGVVAAMQVLCLLRGADEFRKKIGALCVCRPVSKSHKLGDHGVVAVEELVHFVAA